MMNIFDVHRKKQRVCESVEKASCERKSLPEVAVFMW